MHEKEKITTTKKKVGKNVLSTLKINTLDSLDVLDKFVDVGFGSY